MRYTDAAHRAVALARWAWRALKVGDFIEAHRGKAIETPFIVTAIQARVA